MTTTIEKNQRAEVKHVSRPRLIDQLDLAALRTAVSCARVFVKVTLTKWGARSVVDDVLLVVTELVTNAVKATGTLDPQPNVYKLDHLELIGVRLVELPESIVIEVWHSDTKAPAITEADPHAEDGHGLTFVERVARQRGSYSSRGGKVVWAELPVYRTTPSGLPKRQKSSAFTPPPAGMGDRVVPDVELLDHVLEGLRRL